MLVLFSFSYSRVWSCTTRCAPKSTRSTSKQTYGVGHVTESQKSRRQI